MNKLDTEECIHKEFLPLNDESLSLICKNCTGLYKDCSAYVPCCALKEKLDVYRGDHK